MKEKEYLDDQLQANILLKLLHSFPIHYDKVSHVQHKIFYIIHDTYHAHVQRFFLYQSFEKEKVLEKKKEEEKKREEGRSFTCVNVAAICGSGRVENA